MNTDRQIVSEQRQIGLLANGTEVTLSFLGATQSVERSGRNKAVNAIARSALGLVDHTQSLHIDDTGKNGDATMNHGNGLLQHVVTLCVGKEGNLARGAQEEQAINTCVNHAVDRALESLKIKRTLGGQRNDHGRNNAMEFAFSHEKTLFCWIQQTSKL